jgi:hypothetical protein
VGGIVVVAAALGIATLTGKFPVQSNGPSEGTIGAAKRATSDQISSGDVAVGDADVQAFLQSDAFHKIQTDADFRKLVTEGLGKAINDGGLGRYGATEGFGKMVTDAGVQKAIASGELGRIVNDAGFQKLVSGLNRASLDARANVVEKQALDAKSLDKRTMAAKSLDAKSLDKQSMAAKSLDAKSLDAKSLDAKSLDAKSLDAKSLDARALEAGMNKANIESLDRMMTAGFGKFLADPSVQKAIMDPGFGKLVTDPALSKVALDPAFGKMIISPEFGKMLVDPALGKAIAAGSLDRAVTER